MGYVKGGVNPRERVDFAKDGEWVRPVGDIITVGIYPDIAKEIPRGAVFVARGIQDKGTGRSVQMMLERVE